jgi:5-methylcytosine-specific restriction enzyme subunit McrC
VPIDDLSSTLHLLKSTVLNPLRVFWPYGDANSLRLPGFLFDMNRVFQALISRYLQDHLDSYEMYDEHRVFSTIRQTRNPLKRYAPVQKPDFVVRRQGKLVAILDAKYRDLWHHSLPREMLYQLALYALAHPGLKCASWIGP